MKLKISLCFIFLVTNSFYLALVESKNILSIQIFTSKSHKNSYEPMLIELAKRGHNVTVINSEPSPIRNPPIPNLHEIRGIDMIGSLEKSYNFFEIRIKETEHNNPFDVLEPLLLKHCPEFYELDVIQQILREKYDLVMIEPFFNECLFGMFHHFNTTSVLLNSFDTPFWFTNGIGLMTLPSYMPTFPLGFNENMNFWQRLFNFFLHLSMEIHLKSYYPKMEKIYRSYLGSNIPSIPELLSNVDLIMDNSDLTLAISRPTMPEIVRFGGMHCRKPSPLTKDLEDFVANAPHGFIFFSLGSIVLPKQMPEEYRQMFLNVFSKLKQKVIWKWADDTMENLPSNVIVRKWLPQQDILGHKNIRLFISHGGLLSSEESIYHGVPIIGIPMYGDQPFNVDAATKRGFGMKWDLPTLTEEYMLESINEMINNKSYTENVKKLSILHKDRQVEPVDKAVFAIEYVMRHNGFPFKSPTRNLSWIQYFCLDIIAFIFMILISLLIVLFLSVKLLYKCLFSKTTVPKPKQKKK